MYQKASNRYEGYAYLVLAIAAELRVVPGPTSARCSGFLLPSHAERHRATGRAKSLSDKWSQLHSALQSLKVQSICEMDWTRSTWRNRTYEARLE